MYILCEFVMWKKELTAWFCHGEKETVMGLVWVCHREKCLCRCWHIDVCHIVNDECGSICGIKFGTKLGFCCCVEYCDYLSVMSGTRSAYVAQKFVTWVRLLSSSLQSANQYGYAPKEFKFKANKHTRTHNNNNNKTPKNKNHNNNKSFSFV